MIALRPWTQADLALLPGGDSEFDEFGRPPRQELPPSSYDAAGGLVIEENGVPAGTVSWIWLHWGPSTASRNPMIGVWLRRDARGRGIGAAAQRALVDAFFLHTAVNRVEAHTDVENLAEQKVLERIGFTRDGILRGAQWRLGAYHDMVAYSILRREWAT